MLNNETQSSVSPPIYVHEVQHCENWSKLCHAKCEKVKVENAVAGDFYF